MSASENARDPQPDDSSEAHAERVRANGELQAPNLAALALQVHEAEVRARALEAAEAAARNDALRSEYVTRLYQENIAEVRSLVAKRLELPEDSSVLEALAWSIDETSFAKVTFTRASDGRITPDISTRTLMKMRTTLDGMPLVAVPSRASDGARNVHLTAETNLGSVAITSLAELGRELEQYKRW